MTAASDTSRSSGCEPIAVCGAHMSGLPLNATLTERGANFLETTRTAPIYRLFALPGGPPARPGLVRQTSRRDGASIELELWDLPLECWGSFVATIPAPLGIGTIELVYGREVKGFICESAGTQGASDITHHGGWRGYLAAR